MMERRQSQLKKLRQQAQELESILELLTEIHENPAGGLILSTPEDCREQGHLLSVSRTWVSWGKGGGDSIDGAGC